MLVILVKLSVLAKWLAIERSLWWHLHEVRRLSPQRPGGRECLCVFFFCLVCLYCYMSTRPYTIYIIFHTPMAQYSLFVLKVSLNTDKTTPMQNMFARVTSSHVQFVAVNYQAPHSCVAERGNVLRWLNMFVYIYIYTCMFVSMSTRKCLKWLTFNCWLWGKVTCRWSHFILSEIGSGSMLAEMRKHSVWWQWLDEC